MHNTEGLYLASITSVCAPILTPAAFGAYTTPNRFSVYEEPLAAPRPVSRSAYHHVQDKTADAVLVHSIATQQHRNITPPQHCTFVRPQSHLLEHQSVTECCGAPYQSYKVMLPPNGYVPLAMVKSCTHADGLFLASAPLSTARPILVLASCGLRVTRLQSK